jgi:hypothetical protein
VTRTDNECKTAWTTITTTQTRTPVVTVTGTPTRTVTCTKLVPSNVCINNWARDVSLIPDDVTNAERIKLGLPLRSIQEERRFFHLGPSCTPTTITTTTTSTCTTPWVTKVTSTKCGWTKTSVIPNTATVTKTRTECTTVPGTITSTYTKPCVAPTTTTVTRTTTRKVIC